MNKTSRTWLEKQEQTKTFFNGHLYMDALMLVNQQELIYISSVWTQDVVWKTCQEEWMIETDGERVIERESRKSMLTVQLNDDDETSNINVFIFCRFIDIHLIAVKGGFSEFI